MSLDLTLYLWPFLIALGVSVILHAMLLWSARRYSFARGTAQRGARHEETQALTRLGGVMMLVAFLSTLFVDQNLVIEQSAMWALIIGATAMTFFGFLDDVLHLSWQMQLLSQAIIILAVFFFGVQIGVVSVPFVGAIDMTASTLGVGMLVMVVWILTIINTFNWSDGIDGVSGGVAVIAAAAIFFVTLLPEVNQPPVGIIAVTFIGAVSGFLLFNFSPAHILAGTSGSFFMGFVLAVLAIFAGAKIATTFLVLAIPLVDALWVVGERLYARQSIFQADRRHLHHKLLTLGWSHRIIAIVYYAVTIIIALLALQTQSFGKLYVIIGVFSALLIFIGFISHIAKQESSV